MPGSQAEGRCLTVRFVSRILTGGYRDLEVLIA